jgi:hypothetical protein
MEYEVWSMEYGVYGVWSVWSTEYGVQNTEYSAPVVLSM